MLRVWNSAVLRAKGFRDLGLLSWVGLTRLSSREPIRYWLGVRVHRVLLGLKRISRAGVQPVLYYPAAANACTLAAEFPGPR